MITFLDVEDLLDLRSGGQPVVSFYLNTDRSRHTLDQQRVQARNLLREGRKSAEAGPWDETVKAGLLADLDHLDRYLNDLLEPTFPHRGLAVFACQAIQLWRVFNLPRPVPSGVYLEMAPHIRPLTLIMDEYHRFGVLLLDRRTAELYEVYMGEILKLEEAFPASAPPAPVSLAVEHPGSGDRGMSHRGEEETQRHFRHVADALFHRYHRRHYEYLVLGGQQSLLTQFESFLHPTLKERVVGRLAGEPGKTRPARILEETAEIERRVESENERRMVRQLADTAMGRGLAVMGLHPVLEALHRGAVHILLVEEGWHQSGVICRQCGWVGIEGESCPDCRAATEAVGDMADDVIEAALRTGSMIEHVHPTSGLGDHGHIGAFLRFKV
ncbi:MAG: hypothetical protein C4524_09335 [Candidatus Zixiibacteriota bacterium]|nr:MAG: hypothetical protein C4524_09335 [candidate division Zixibacteria bacterium]